MECTGGNETSTPRVNAWSAQTALALAFSRFFFALFRDFVIDQNRIVFTERQSGGGIRTI